MPLCFSRLATNRRLVTQPRPRPTPRRLPRVMPPRYMRPPRHTSCPSPRSTTLPSRRCTQRLRPMPASLPTVHLGTALLALSRGTTLLLKGIQLSKGTRSSSRHTSSPSTLSSPTTPVPPDISKDAPSLEIPRFQVTVVTTSERVAGEQAWIES